MRFALLIFLAASFAGCDSGTPPAAGTLLVGRADGSVDRIAAGSDAAESVLAASDGPVTGIDATTGRIVALVDGTDGRVVIVDADGTVRTVPVVTPWALAVSDGVAYVASRDASALVPVYLAQRQAGPPILVAQRPEGVVVVGQRAFVANTGDGYWRVLDLVDTESLSPISPYSRVDVCTGPRTVWADADGDVWVVCTGRAAPDGTVADAGGVRVLDGFSGDILAEFPAPGLLGTSGVGRDGAVAREAGEAFVLRDGDLLRFDTRAHTATGIVPIGGPPITAVAYDAAADRLVLGRRDAPGAATGFVSLHTRDGAETARLAAGIAPTALAVTPVR